MHTSNFFVSAAPIHSSLNLNYLQIAQISVTVSYLVSLILLFFHYNLLFIQESTLYKTNHIIVHMFKTLSNSQFYSKQIADSFLIRLLMFGSLFQFYLSILHLKLPCVSHNGLGFFNLCCSMWRPLATPASETCTAWLVGTEMCVSMQHTLTFRLSIKGCKIMFWIYQVK